MLPATQYQLTNANDAERKYTYSAKITTAPPGSATGWQVSIVGANECTPDEACKLLLQAMAEVRDAIKRSTATDVPVVERPHPEHPDPDGPRPVAEVDDIEVEPPAAPSSSVSSVGGVVVEMREAGAAPGGVPRPPGWPQGDTF